jgi:integrase/recombinase XerD
VDAVESGAVAVLPASLDAPVCREASTDDQLVALWLGTYRSPHTVRGYAADAAAFRRFVGKPLRDVRLVDVQAFSASLAGIADSTTARRLSGVKSLVGFGHRIGYLLFDTAAPVRLPPIQDRLAERILTEWQVQRVLELERDPRNAAILRLLYSAGLRIAELCGLRWRNLVARTEGGQISVFGKGGKTRVIVLPGSMWARLDAMRATSAPDDPVFRSRKGGGPVGPRQVHSIVKAAAERAKLPTEVSAHWFRHAHASHALDRAAPIHVVQTTLGHASLTTTTRYSHARPGDSSAKYLVA